MSNTVQTPPGRSDLQARMRQPIIGAGDVFGAMAILLITSTVFLWMFNQGLASVTTSVDRAIGSLGLLTGLLSSILMILQVLVLARIPWVEQAWGHDLLARRHKWYGYASFWLLIAHVIAYVIDRWTRDPDHPGTAMLDLFIRDPWMLWATFGTVLIIAVVASSIAYARRRLRYETWHLLHLYAYLGMGFGLPHQIMDGADFHKLYEQIFWWGIYALTLATIIVFRVIVPLWNSYRCRLTVKTVTPAGPGVTTVTMTGRRLDRLATKSGQFFIWRFLDGPGWSRGKPYTISDAPEDNRLEVTIQAVGETSSRAALLTPGTPGTPVVIEGPYGTMTAERRRHRKVLFAAAGVGITPIRALMADMPLEPATATLIYRYSDEEHIIFRDELRQLGAERGIRIILLPGSRAADDSWLPAGHGDDVAELRRLVPDLVDHDIFVCGPPQWLRGFKRAARKCGVTPKQIHSEDFAW